MEPFTSWPPLCIWTWLVWKLPDDSCSGAFVKWAGSLSQFSSFWTEAHITHRNHCHNWNELSPFLSVSAEKDWTHLEISQPLFIFKERAKVTSTVYLIMLFVEVSAPFIGGAVMPLPCIRNRVRLHWPWGNTGQEMPLVTQPLPVSLCTYGE